MRKVVSISAVADEVLADAARVEQTKTAEAAALREASRPSRGELGALFHKVAEDLRAAPTDVTYADLHSYLAGGSR